MTASIEVTQTMGKEGNGSFLSLIGNQHQIKIRSSLLAPLRSHNFAAD